MAARLGCHPGGGFAKRVDRAGPQLLGTGAIFHLTGSSAEISRNMPNPPCSWIHVKLLTAGSAAGWVDFSLSSSYFVDVEVFVKSPESGAPTPFSRRVISGGGGWG